jgi:serine/threonine protein kinase
MIAIVATGDPKADSPRVAVDAATQLASPNTVTEHSGTTSSQTALTGDPNTDTRYAGDPNADTQLVEASGAATSSAGPPPAEVARPSVVRIRPSRPSLVDAPDYPELVTVDPAHYVVGRELARGGMGRIQVARDRRLGREVAIKETLVDRGPVRRRFEREARITARLQHPSIIGVHEAGVWPSGEPFYAMPLVSGRPLEDAIAATRTFEERLALLPNVIALADAMAYAHDRRVIHRDLKPRNVLVGAFGETVVIDWGLAKELDVSAPAASLAPDSTPADASRENTSGGGSSSSSETTLGDVLGTPAYMPPEQAAGQPVDERADVYAIGGILYHLLAGTPPFDAPNKTELLSKVLARAPRPISEVARQTPRELAAIVDQAMARDLGVRYRTARELADDLRRFQTGQLVAAHRYSLRHLLRRWVRRHRTAVAAAATATIVALVIGVFAVQRIVAAQQLAEQQRALARANQASAEDLLRFMLVDLREKLAKVGRLELLDDVARRAASHFDARGAASSEDDLYLNALARDGIGSVLVARGDLAAAHIELAKAQAALVELVARNPHATPYRARLARARYALARIAIARGDLRDAMATARESLADVERHAATLAAAAPAPGSPASSDSTELARAILDGHKLVAEIYEDLGDPDAALAAYQRLLALAEAHAADSAADLAARRRVLAVHSSIGRILRKAKHDYPGALAAYRRGLEIGEQLAAAEPDNPSRVSDVAISRLQIGHLLHDMKQYDAALLELTAAATAFRRLIALDPTNASWKGSLWSVHEKLGMVRFAQQDYAGALAEYEQAHALSLQALARDPSNTSEQRGQSMILNKLGDVQLATKDARAALASYKQALVTREQLVAVDPANATWRRDRFYSHVKLTEAYLAIPEATREARSSIQQALALAEENLRLHPKNPGFQHDVADTYGGLGETLATLGDRAGARAAYDTALERARSFAGATPDADWQRVIDGIAAKRAQLAR